MCATIFTTISNNKRSNTDLAQEQRPRKMQRILMSSLPDRLSTQHVEESNPESLLKGPIYSFSDLLDNFFQAPTDEEIAAYDFTSTNAIRNQDMAALRQFHKEGRPLKCSNKFGESLLHMACRKNMVEVTTFLVQEAQVPLQVCDDYGKSPLTDACWAHETNFELIDLILGACPDLLYIQDKRGFTPLAYLKQEKWAAWNVYLQSKSPEFLKPKYLTLAHKQ